MSEDEDDVYQCEACGVELRGDAVNFDVEDLALCKGDYDHLLDAEYGP